jgi:hypothetical protein
VLFRSDDASGGYDDASGGGYDEEN